jgi:hypothetical protein
LPEGIRGYGHVKDRHLEDTAKRWDEALGGLECLLGEGVSAQAPKSEGPAAKALELSRIEGSSA